MNALTIMKTINPNVFTQADDNIAYLIEDFGTLSDVFYRLEYQSSHDGTRAIAYVRHYPGERALDPHLKEDGRLDLGPGTEQIETSPLSLREAIFKARFWCTAHQHCLTHNSLLEAPHHETQ